MSAALWERRRLDVQIVWRAARDLAGRCAGGGFGEGVFVANAAEVAGRFLRERIFFRPRRGLRVCRAIHAQHMFADREERGVMRGMAAGSEPGLPVEARVFALEDTFPARMGHGGEEARAVGRAA